MPSYEDDLPTENEEYLLKILRENTNEQQRYDVLVQLKNFVIGSKRCKTVLFRAGVVDLLFNLLKEYSSLNNEKILIVILDCLSSFIKSTNSHLFQHLIELNCLEELFHLLINSHLYSNDFIESILRCLRSFFPLNTSNSIPFILVCDQTFFQSRISTTTRKFSSKSYISIDFLFEHSQALDQLIRLLNLSKTIQIILIEIFCCLCINNQRQEQLIEKNLLSFLRNIFIENLSENSNDYLSEICLKCFCSLTYENSFVGQLIIQTNENLCNLISNLLKYRHRSIMISYYASKFFVHLCKINVLSVEHPYVALLSLTTLIHLSTKTILNKSIYLYIECLETLIYLLNGNNNLHHLAIYTEQFLKKLFLYVYTPTKILDELLINDESLVQIRASALTLLAVLSSHHEDIRKRIADDENLISTTIDCYRSSNILLQLSALRLFHGLSRSVQQLQTTFNDTIGEILLEAIQSNNIDIMKISSCVISNIVLEFSTCQTKLLSGGILNILFSCLTHTDHDLRINSIWALRNLSYLAPFNIKQDIINGLTIEKIYSLLEQCTDEQFLICLLSLLRNLFDEKDTDAILPIFNATKLLTTLQHLFEKTNPEVIRRELDRLISHLNSTINPMKNSSESVNSTCRTSLFPEYACEDMDHQLDCS